MKNRISAALVLAASFLVSFFGFAPAAQGATSSMSFSGAYSAGGFDVSYGATEIYGPESANGRSFVSMAVQSNLHRITGITTSFWTNANDPSYGLGVISVSGVVHSSPSTSPTNWSSEFSRDGTFIRQAGFIGSDFDNSGASNFSYGEIVLEPFDVWGGNVSYSEYISQYTGRLLFTLQLSFDGSFGDGPEGDGRGMAFRAVPTPGAISLAGLGGLALLRRARRN